MRRWRIDDQPRVRWRNDGGYTREVISEPVGAAAFDWRVSVADVEVDGPFSFFDGCDRALVLLDGAGMRLHLTDTDTVLTVDEDAPVARFPGEASIHAELIDGRTSDFNLMWRRDRVVADVHTCEGCGEFGGGWPGHVVGGLLLHGSATVNETRLRPGELFVGGPGEAVALRCDGRMVHFLVGPITG